MKKKVLTILKYVCIFTALIIVFNILLYLVCSFSSNKLEKNARQSYDILREQGMFYVLSDMFYIINNNCTDTVIVNESYSVDKKTPYTSYMKARKNYKRGLTTHELEESTGEGVTVNYNEETDEEVVNYEYEPISEFGDFLNGKIHYSLNYARYWHGYLILYRPLLTQFNISQIRTLLLITYILLFIGFIYLVNKRFGKINAIIFGASLICTGYFSASYSLESSPIFLVTMISSIILLKRIDKIKNFSIYIFVVACVANFVDYLTVPLISLGIPIGLYLIKLLEEGKDYKYCLKFLIRNSIIWFLGYSCTWISKWILYDITIGGTESIIAVGFRQSFYRMERINYTVSDSDKYIFYTIINIIGKASLYSLITACIILKINKFKIINNNSNKKCIIFLLLAIYPVVWYFILANHTVMHNYFTYRQSLLFMLGILLAMNEFLFHQDEKPKLTRNNNKK